MTVLVVGSSGLVGRRLVAQLAADGLPVVAADVVHPTSDARPRVEGVEYVTADVRRLDQLLGLIQAHAVQKVALLSYIMGPLMSPRYADLTTAGEVNIAGVTTVLEAARLGDVERIVFLSTVGTYGPQRLYGDRAVTEDDLLAPTSLYGRMKALNESVCEKYAALYGIEVIKVRPSSILGPGSTIWPARMFERVAVGAVGQVPYGEDARDNVIAVSDLSVLLSRLLTVSKPAHDTYLASGHNVTMADLVDAVHACMPDAKLEFPSVPRRPTYPQFFDNSRAVDEFDWHIADLRESVRRYLDASRAESGLPTLAR